MFQLDDGGLIRGAEYIPSPNCGDRPVNAEVSLLVVHNISLPPGKFGGGHIERFFLNQLDPSVDPYFETITHLEVSAHFLIERNGRVIQFVPLHKRAWHAGESCYEGIENCNDFSIGIELEGCDDTPYTDIQYTVLAQLSELLISACPKLSPDRICGHNEISPGRKTDPGPSFDWPKYQLLLNDLSMVMR